MFKNLHSLSIAFRIKPKLLSIQVDAPLSFLISILVVLVPKKAILVGALLLSWLPQREGAWSPWLEPGTFPLRSQNTLDLS